VSRRCPTSAGGKRTSRIGPSAAPSFATEVDRILADPRGWTASAAAPVTDVAQNLASASWSFQRTSGTDYRVRILLATPGTTDSMCGSVGMDTGGVYSCRYGNTILINLRRWLNGAPGFDINLDGYHSMVINHEVGHRLGFRHMTCPAAGSPAPIMQEVTINLAGCVPNPVPVQRVLHRPLVPVADHWPCTRWSGRFYSCTPITAADDRADRGQGWGAVVTVSEVVNGRSDVSSETRGLVERVER
jgi:hypothetical protein